MPVTQHASLTYKLTTASASNREFIVLETIFKFDGLLRAVEIYAETAGSITLMVGFYFIFHSVGTLVLFLFYNRT